MDSRTDRGFCLERGALMDAVSEVVVVGAGPTGLMLAGDLARAGVGCTVLERRTEESNLTRAFAVHARTLELLDARGLADDLVATGARVGALRLFGKLEVDLSRLPTRFPYVLVTPQYNTEGVLEERASALGAQIVRGAEVVDLRQDNDGVELEVRYEDGTLGTRRATYAVGADGVRSTVRQALALPFPGHSAVQSVMLADVRLSEAPEEVLTVNAAGDGFSFLAPFGDGWYRSSPGTGAGSCQTTRRSSWRRSAISPSACWAPTSVCTTPAGCPDSTVTSAKFHTIGSGECSLPATPHIVTLQLEVRA